MNPTRAINILVSIANEWLQGIEPEYLEEFKAQYGLTDETKEDIDDAINTVINTFGS